MNPREQFWDCEKMYLTLTSDEWPRDAGACMVICKKAKHTHRTTRDKAAGHIQGVISKFLTCSLTKRPDG